MSLGLRILLGYFLIVGLAAYLFVDGLLVELRPGVRQAAEHTLVNTANLLAEMVGLELAEGNIGQGGLAAAVERFAKRRFGALIWSQPHDVPDLRVYITDRLGIVVFDSTGEAVGEDYSRWNDVYRTLRGQYGARSSKEDPDDELSTSMYVAAPIRHGKEVIGVLTVAQPNLSLQPFVDMASRNVRNKGLWLLALALGLGALIVLWLTRSIRRLARYADQVRSGDRVTVPRLGEPELARLGRAMESMREELEGTAYVERYIHSLTHEMKGPLAAIAGAAEILEGQPSAEARRRFAANVRVESERLHLFVERLLALANVEKRRGLKDVELIPLGELIAEALEGKEARLEEKSITLTGRWDADLSVRGERFLLRQAISNLLDNAIDFSPQDGRIEIETRAGGGQLALCIGDQGPGIPDYAREHVMQRFYSLARPDTGRKSSGLGLSFVAEVAELHGGAIRLCNAGGGALATLTLPLGS